MINILYKINIRRLASGFWFYDNIEYTVCSMKSCPNFYSNLLYNWVKTSWTYRMQDLNRMSQHFMTRKNRLLTLMIIVCKIIIREGFYAIVLNEREIAVQQSTNLCDMVESDEENWGEDEDRRGNQQERVRQVQEP